MKKNNQFINEPSVKKLPTSRNVVFQDIPEDYGNHFSLIKLREFLKKLVFVIDRSQKMKKNSFIEGEKVIDKQSEESTSDTKYEYEKKLALDVRDEICNYLGMQEVEFRKLGTSLEKEKYDEICYLQSALADEFLLAYDWPSRFIFTEFLIEEKLFGTRIAGEKVFENIERVLEKSPGREVELAQLYLHALSIGFEGKFKGSLSSEKIDRIIKSLFLHIARTDPELGPLNHNGMSPERKINFKDYESIISKLKPLKYFRFSKYSLIGFSILIALLLASQVIYIVVTKPLREVIEDNKYTVSMGYETKIACTESTGVKKLCMRFFNA